MMNNSFSFYVQRYFSSFMVAQNNYGANTLSSYSYTFKLLLKYLAVANVKKNNLLITQVDKECILDFLKWLDTERHNSISTRNVRLAHLKSFYHYVYTEAPHLAMHCDKIIGIPFATAPVRPPLSLTEEATGALLNSIDSTNRNGLRHLAILALLYDSACRVQELIELKVSDIQLEKNCRVYLHGKGDKHRIVLILPETEKILRKYIGAFKLNPSDTLFCNRSGEALTRQGVRYIMRKYTNIVKNEYPEEAVLKAHPHLMRHSKATHLVNSGINILNVKDFLGHESVETTQIYVTSNPEVTRKAIEKASAKTVAGSEDYYTPSEKEELLDFLETFKQK
jgi:site-specific recombinase XerD